MKRLFADKKLRNDLILIAALLLIAGVLYLALNLGRQEGGVAVVRVDGVEVERHSLSVNGTFPLNGGSNILVISASSRERSTTPARSSPVSPTA